MNTNKYGLAHFKHKTNYGSMVVFSDEEVLFTPQEPKNVSENRYINIYKDVETDHWIANLRLQLSGEYGDYTIYEEELSPEGSITFSEIPIYLGLEDQVFGDSEMDYYEIDGKLFLQVNTIVQLDEVVVTAKGNKRNIVVPPQESLEAFVTVFVSADGAKLERAYQSIDQIHDREMVFFAEKDDPTNIFGSVFRVNTGVKISSKSIYPKIDLAGLLRKYTNDPTLNATAISELVKEYFEDKNNPSVFLWLPRLATSFIKIAADYTLQPLGDVMYDIAEEIDKGLRLGDNYWKATIDGKPNSSYDPLIPGYDLLIDADLAEKWAKKLNKSFIEPLAKPAKKMIRKLRRDKLTKRFIGNRLDGLLNFIEAIPEHLNTIIKGIFTFLRKAFEFYNALLVGIINSLVDLLKSIFDIIGMICKGLYALIAVADQAAKTPGSFVGMILEAFENLISIVASVFTIDNLVAFIGFQIYVIQSAGQLGVIAIQKVAEFIAGDSESKDNEDESVNIPFDAIGYYTGYIIGFIAQEVAIFMATAGIGTIAEGIRGAVRSYVELGKAIGRVSKSAARAAHKTVKVTVETFLKTLEAIKRFALNIPKHLKTLKTWINDLLASLKSKALLIEGVAFTVVDPITAFASFFVTALKRSWWGQIAKLNVKFLKNENGFYTIYYNDKIIKEGLTKSEAESLLEELFKRRSGSNPGGASKYLDELAESKILDDIINEQNFKFRKLGFKFTHSKTIAKDGVIDISMSLVDANGKRIQGISNINNKVLENYFDVTIKGEGVSKAMYKFLDNFDFDAISGYYKGGGEIADNYDAFMKVFDKTDDAIKAAYATPAGRVIEKLLKDTYVPVIKTNDKAKKLVEVIWKKI